MSRTKHKICVLVFHLLYRKIVESVMSDTPWVCARNHNFTKAACSKRCDLAVAPRTDTTCKSFASAECSSGRKCGCSWLLRKSCQISPSFFIIHSSYRSKTVVSWVIGHKCTLEDVVSRSHTLNNGKFWARRPAQKDTATRVSGAPKARAGRNMIFAPEILEKYIKFHASSSSRLNLGGVERVFSAPKWNVRGWEGGGGRIQRKSVESKSMFDTPKSSSTSSSSGEECGCYRTTFQGWGCDLAHWASCDGGRATSGGLEGGQSY